MGIRFRCHHCEHELHVKDFQGGKRGRCPECQGKFRIPSEDAEHSLPVEENELSGVGAEQASLAGANQLARAAAGTQGNAKAAAIRKAPSVEQAESSRRNPQASPAKPSTVSPAKPSSVGPAKPSSTSSQSTSDAASGAGAIDSPSQVAEPEAIPQGTEMRLLPRAVTDFPASIWHVRPASGGQYGPAPAEVFTQWLIEGRVDQQALVWRDDWPDWQPAHSVFPEFYQPAAETKPKPTAGSPPVPVPPVAPPNPATPATTADVANPRRDRRRRQRQRNILIVSVLVVLFLGLLAALAVVLMTQGS